MVSKEYIYDEFESVMVQITRILDNNEGFPVDFVHAAYADWVCKHWKIDRYDREREYTSKFLPWMEQWVCYSKSNPYFDYWFCSEDHSINALKFKLLQNKVISKFIDSAVDDLAVSSLEAFTDESFKAHLRDMSLRFLADCAYHSNSTSKLTFHYGTCLTILTQNVYFLLKYYDFSTVESMFKDRFKWPKCYTLAAITMMGLVKKLCD